MNNKVDKKNKVLEKSISNKNNMEPEINDIERKLELYREEIDEIDKKLLILFERRLEVVSKVADVKKSINMDILDASRESKVLEKVETNLKDKNNKVHVNRFFKSLMDISKDFQKEKNR